MTTRSLTSWSFCNFTMVVLLWLTTHSAVAQGTAFTYQGKLSDSGNPANGNYDFQFALFDMVSNGTQQGTTLTLNNVTVTNGTFTVTLDFGACSSCFNGAARFLEIAVRPSGGGSFTTLTPRQPITSTPYALKTSNLLFNGAYNNGTGTVFTASNTFAGEAAGLNTIPNPILNFTSGKFNAFFGAGAGQANTTGSNNAFFGSRAGFNHTTGNQNAFFGSLAGFSNTTGGVNAFFGSQAGQANTTGPANAFFGALAGVSNTTGNSNAFFGCQAGADNPIASSNAFFGAGAGEFNTTGSNNAFFGFQSGIFNTVGSNNAFFGNQAGMNNDMGIRNTFIGDEADFSDSEPTGNLNTLLGFSAKVVSGVSNATAIGASAQVTQSNSLILGSINGVNGATADTNIGIGTATPISTLPVRQGDSGATPAAGTYP